MKTTGINNYILGIPTVFDKSKIQEHLDFRFGQWNVIAPFKFSPELSILPPVIPEALPQISTLEKGVQKELQLRKNCIENNMNFYFPLLEKEKIEEDTLTITSKATANYPKETIIWIRKTNLAVYFAIAADWQFDIIQSKLTTKSIENLNDLHPVLYRSAKSDEGIETVRKVLDLFASAFPGPEKYGIKLLSLALGLANSDSGPSWDEIYAMIRTIVREEIIKDSLTKIHSEFTALAEWSNDHYLPLKNKKRTKNKKLLDLLEPKMNPMLKNLSLLTEPQYRIPGFVLLLQGINMYLTLIQEKLSIGGSTRNIRSIANDWANEMLRIWAEVKEHRASEIVVEKKSHSKPLADKSIVTIEYYIILDKHTGHKTGDRNGPWTVNGKNSKAKDNANEELIKHRRNVLATLTRNLADPDKTASKWRNIWIPE